MTVSELVKEVKTLPPEERWEFFVAVKPLLVESQGKPSVNTARSAVPDFEARWNAMGLKEEWTREELDALDKLIAGEDRTLW